MTLPVVFRRVARQEMDESIAWYETKGAGLGKEFATEIEKFLDRIASNPEKFQRVREMVRRAVLLRFPYAIHFLIESERIVVLAVFHVRRNPRRLEGR